MTYDEKVTPRVFVVGTGRCGTSTFYQACLHATNYLSRHEAYAIGDCPPFFFPEHPSIEIGSTLTMFIPRLKRRFPQARWVHLQRERQACCESIARECHEESVGFAKRWLWKSEINPVRAAEIFYDSVNDLCQSLLPEAFHLQLETVEQQWLDCWKFMNCVGDFSSSLSVWRRKYNPSCARGRDSFISAAGA